MTEQAREEEAPLFNLQEMLYTWYKCDMEIYDRVIKIVWERDRSNTSCLGLCYRHNNVVSRTRQVPETSHPVLRGGRVLRGRGRRRHY